MKWNEKIRANRRAMDLTQREIAEILGRTKETVSQYETGRVTPPMSVMAIYIKLFETTADVLFFDDSDRLK